MSITHSRGLADIMTSITVRLGTKGASKNQWNAQSYSNNKCTGTQRSIDVVTPSRVGIYITRGKCIFHHYNTYGNIVRPAGTDKLTIEVLPEFTHSLQAGHSILLIDLQYHILFLSSYLRRDRRWNKRSKSSFTCQGSSG